MKEERTYYTGKVKQKGIFDFKGYYKVAYDWLRYSGYTIHEKQYLEEIEKQGKKIIIEWVATKKISDYFQFQMKISWFILKMNDIEIMKEGRKVPMQRGEPSIKIKAILVKDYQSKWNTPFLEAMRRIYDKYMYRVRIEKYKLTLVNDTEEFIRQCKDYLAIEGYPESHLDYPNPYL